MAKRKKVNKGLVLALILTTGMLLGVGALGVYKFRNKLFPKDPLKYEQLGDQARERGDFMATEKNYGVAVTFTDPPRPALYYKLAAFQLEWLKDPEGLSEVERVKRIGSAYGLLREAVRLDPKYREALRMLCDMEWGFALMSERWGEFAADAERLVEVDPNDHLAFYQLGLAQQNLISISGSTAEKAEASLKKAVELKSDEPSYRLGLAQFYRTVARDQVLERKVLEEAVAAIPGSASVRTAYSTFLYPQDKARAIQVAKEAKQAEPTSPLGNIQLSIYYMDEAARLRDPAERQAKYDEAIAELQEARKLDDTDLRIYDMLATCYTRKRQPEQAATSLREGVALIDQKLQALSAPTATRGVRNDKPRLETDKAALTAMLADVLLDMTDEGAENKDALLAEARACRETLAKLSLRLRGGAAHEQKILGRIAYAEGNDVEACKQLEQAYQVFKTDDPKTAAVLVKAYSRMKRHGLAEKVVDDFLKLPSQRNNATLLSFKAKYEADRRNFDEALRYLKMAIDLEPDNETFKRMRGQLDVSSNLGHAQRLWFSNQRDDAITYLEGVFRQSKDRSVVYPLASMYVQLRQQDKAKLLLQEALKLYPDEQLWKEQLALLEEPPDKQFDKRMEMADRNADPLDKALEKAQISRLANRQELVDQYLAEAAKINADDVRVIEAMFATALVRRDWAKAQEHVDRARKLDSDGAGGNLLAAQLALTQQQYGPAIPLLNEALKRKPDLRLAKAMLGDCYRATNDLARAEETFRSLATEDPSFAPAAIGMAQVTELQGKTDEWAQWVERAYRLAPQHAYVQEAHLEIDEEKGNLDAIIQRREAMLEQSPGNLRNRLRLASLYERTRQFSKAEQAYRFLATTSADHVGASRMLADFYARTNRLVDASRIFEDLIRQTTDSQQKTSALLGYAQFLAQTNPGQAIALCQRASQEAPDDPRPHLELSRLHASQSQWSQAVEALKQYMKMTPPDSQAERQLIQYLVEAGQQQEASSRIEAVLAKNPSDATVLGLKSVVLFQGGKIDEALDLLNRALQADPTNQAALIYRSRVHMAKGLPDRAEADLLNLQKAQDTPEVSLLLARFYASLADYVKAERVLRGVLAKREKYPPAIDGLLELYLRQQKWDALEKELVGTERDFPAEVKYPLLEGQMWETRGDKAKAAQAFEKAVRTNPGSEVALRAYWVALLEVGKAPEVLSLSQDYSERADYAVWVRSIRGRAMVKADRPAEAEAQFIAAMKACAQRGDLNFVYTQAAQAYGQGKAAEKWAGWVGQTIPDNVLAYSVLGSACADNGNYDQAEKALLKARELAKDNQEVLANVLVQLGTMYYQAKQTDKAERVFEETIRLRPNDPRTANNLAYLYAEDLNKPQEALKLAEVAFRAMPGDPMVLDTYGWVLAKLGRYADAEKYLRISAEMTRTDPFCLYHLGWVCEKTGRVGEAGDMYRRALPLAKDKKDPTLERQLQEGLQRTAVP